MAVIPDAVGEKLKAVVIVQATPFNRDGGADFEGLKANTKFLVDRRAGKRFVLVPVGSTGEAYALGDRERMSVIETVLEAAGGKLPMVAAQPRPARSAPSSCRKRWRRLVPTVSARPEVHNIWFSPYTPREGEDSGERLIPKERMDVIRELSEIRCAYPKLYLSLPLPAGSSARRSHHGNAFFRKLPLLSRLSSTRESGRANWLDVPFAASVAASPPLDGFLGWWWPMASGSSWRSNRVLDKA